MDSASGSASASASATTRQKLLDGAIQTVREHGIAGVSARTIATAAGVNQALVFYHYGSVSLLLKEACLQATARQVEDVRDSFRSAGSLRELLAAGRQMREQQREQGDVAVLAQFLAGAQHSPELAEATREALGLWIVELDAVLERLLRPTPVGGLIDVRGLAHALASAFVGMVLYEGVDPEGASGAFAALEDLALIVEALEELGPVATRAAARTLRRGMKRPGPQS
jgi:AcrR family transcriptional regulator